MARLRLAGGGAGLRDLLIERYRGLIERYGGRDWPTCWHRPLGALEAGEPVTVRGWELPAGHRMGSECAWEWFTVEGDGTVTTGSSHVEPGSGRGEGEGAGAR